MRFLKFVGKMVLKLVALPVLFVLGLICLLAKLVVNVSSFAIYYIVANEDFELIKVGRYKRATKESFEKWYQNQTRYQLAEDRQERS